MSVATPPAEEALINERLRAVDWRFLLGLEEAPRYLDLSRGSLSPSLALIGEEASAADAEVDLAVLGFPTAKDLATARDRLAGNGEIACIWRGPRPGGVARAKTRLRRAGFVDVRLSQPGPDPSKTPELWLPLEATTARRAALAERPPRSRREALLRRAWLRFGPVCALARLPGGAANGGGGADGLPDADAWVLLTGGPESDAKVVGLPQFETPPQQDVVVKFARVAKADRALEREVEVLHLLERERPELAGVPRIRASARRVGRVAIAQDAVHGKALGGAIDRASFATVVAEVTGWLAALVGKATAQPASAWVERLVHAPLDELDRDFAGRVPADLPQRARELLAGLGDLPPACEHRDFGPWNIIVEEDGSLAAIDWEDAEPQGLPGLDLAYFLASAAFELDGGLDSTDRLEQARRRNRELLDPGTEMGAIASRCAGRYCDAVGIGPSELPRLRLLTWIVQSLIALRRLPQGADRTVPAASDAELFLALAQDELERLEAEPQ
jgi:Phosphotransferase enzyme family